MADPILSVLMSHLNGSYDVVEQIRASSVLTCFTGASREATEMVYQTVDIKILG